MVKLKTCKVPRPTAPDALSSEQAHGQQLCPKPPHPRPARHTQSPTQRGSPFTDGASVVVDNTLTRSWCCSYAVLLEPMPNGRVCRAERRGNGALAESFACFQVQHIVVNSVTTMCPKFFGWRAGTSAPARADLETDRAFPSRHRRLCP